MNLLHCSQLETRVAQGAGIGGGDLDGARGVAVDADGLGSELHFGDVVCSDDTAPLLFLPL